MEENYPIYPYAKEAVEKETARLVWLDYPGEYRFDEFHSHRYYEVFVFTEGGGVHNINFTEHSIAENSIHLLAANHLHWLERGKNSKGFVVLYREEFLQQLALAHLPNINTDIFSSSQVINLSGPQLRDFKHIFKELEQNKENSTYMLSLIGTFLTKIALRFSEKPAHPYGHDEVVSQLMQLINTHYKERLSTPNYAEMLAVSPSQLRKKIKKHTGRTIKKLQQERLIKEAKRLLHFPSYTIGEIAFQLNFKQASHFSTWYKKHTGYSPKSYKRAKL